MVTLPLGSYFASVNTIFGGIGLQTPLRAPVALGSAATLTHTHVHRQLDLRGGIGSTHGERRPHWLRDCCISGRSKRARSRRGREEEVKVERLAGFVVCTSHHLRLYYVPKEAKGGRKKNHRNSFVTALFKQRKMTRFFLFFREASSEEIQDPSVHNATSVGACSPIAF